MAPPPPTPLHLLRHHQAPLSALAFSPNNTFLYSGDQDGVVSITDLRLRRTVRTWKAHDGGILSLEEWNGRLLSHGRDNKLQVHLLPPPTAPRLVGPSASTAPLDVEQTLPTNSLNFCRFSLLPLPQPGAPFFGSSSSSARGRNDTDRAAADKGKGKGKGRAVPPPEALLALPNLSDSEMVDVYHLPSLTRLHAGVNWAPRGPRPMDGGKQEGRTGLVMGIHLGFLPSVSSSSDEGHAGDGASSAAGSRLGCVLAYEDGRVELWGSASSSAEGSESWREKSDSRMGVGPKWDRLWEAKGHNEAVMALAVDRQFSKAYTVSADHLVVRYYLASALEHQTAVAKPARDSSGKAVSAAGAEQVDMVKKYPLKQIGNGSVAVSADGRVVAVGGWDGRIRLFSTATFKPLGTLSYHRESTHCLMFANPPVVSATSAVQPVTDDESTDGGSVSAPEPEASTIDLDQADLESSGDDTEKDDDAGPPRSRWLASGGKDRRVAIWGLMDFGQSPSLGAAGHAADA